MHKHTAAAAAVTGGGDVFSVYLERLKANQRQSTSQRKIKQEKRRYVTNDKWFRLFKDFKYGGSSKSSGGSSSGSASSRDASDEYMVLDKQWHKSLKRITPVGSALGQPPNVVERHLLLIFRNTAHPLGALLHRFSNLFHASFDYSRRLKRSGTKGGGGGRRRRSALEGGTGTGANEGRRLSRSGYSDTSAPTYSVATATTSSGGTGTGDHYDGTTATAETRSAHSDVTPRTDSFLSRILNSLGSSSSSSSGGKSSSKKNKTKKQTASTMKRSPKSKSKSEKSNGVFSLRATRKHKRSLSSDSLFTHSSNSLLFVAGAEGGAGAGAPTGAARFSQRQAEELLTRAIRDVIAFQERFLMLVYQLFPRVNTQAYRVSSRRALHEAMFELLSPTLTALFQKANEKEDRDFHFNVSALRDVVTLSSVGVAPEYQLNRHAMPLPPHSSNEGEPSSSPPIGGVPPADANAVSTPSIAAHSGGVDAGVPIVTGGAHSGDADLLLPGSASGVVHSGDADAPASVDADPMEATVPGGDAGDDSRETKNSMDALGANRQCQLLDRSMASASTRRSRSPRRRPMSFLRPNTDERHLRSLSENFILERVRARARARARSRTTPMPPPPLPAPFPAPSLALALSSDLSLIVARDTASSNREKSHISSSSSSPPPSQQQQPHQAEHRRPRSHSPCCRSSINAKPQIVLSMTPTTPATAARRRPPPPPRPIPPPSSASAPTSLDNHVIDVDYFSHSRYLSRSRSPQSSSRSRSHSRSRRSSHSPRSRSNSPHSTRSRSHSPHSSHSSHSHPRHRTLRSRSRSPHHHPSHSRHHSPHASDPPRGPSEPSSPSISDKRDSKHRSDSPVRRSVFSYMKLRSKSACEPSRHSPSPMPPLPPAAPLHSKNHAEQSLATSSNKSIQNLSTTSSRSDSQPGTQAVLANPAKSARTNAHAVPANSVIVSTNPDKPMASNGKPTASNGKPVANADTTSRGTGKPAAPKSTSSTCEPTEGADGTLGGDEPSLPKEFPSHESDDGDDESVPYEAAIHELCKLPTQVSPTGKIGAILAMSDAICDCVDEFHEKIGRTHDDLGSGKMNADDLLAIFSYVLIKANLPDLISQTQFIDEFLPAGLRMSMPGYYLATLRAAIALINSLGEEFAELKQ